MAASSGKYYNETMLGRVFIGSTAAGGTAFPISTGTAVTFGLWNTSTNLQRGADVVPCRLHVRHDRHRRVWPLQPVCGFTIGTAAPLSAFTAGTPKNAKLGKGNASVMRSPPLPRPSPPAARAATVDGRVERDRHRRSRRFGDELRLRRQGGRASRPTGLHRRLRRSDRPLHHEPCLVGSARSSRSRRASPMPMQTTSQLLLDGTATHNAIYRALRRDRRRDQRSQGPRLRSQPVRFGPDAYQAGRILRQWRGGGASIGTRMIRRPSSFWRGSGSSITNYSGGAKNPALAPVGEYQDPSANGDILFTTLGFDSGSNYSHQAADEEVVTTRPMRSARMGRLGSRRSARVVGVSWPTTGGGFVGSGEPTLPPINGIRNPTGAGAIVGSPGTIPTNWQTNVSAGFTASVAASSTRRAAISPRTAGPIRRLAALALV
jgi:hypothetical protein